MKYDFVIVGAGLFGSVFAFEAKKKGKKCLIIDKRNHIGGNCFTEKKDNIDIHKYGPHIFHTNDKKIWDWVNQFDEFNNYKHSPKVNYKNKIYSFPINLLTLNQLWGVKTPEEANEKLNSVKLKIQKPKNLEEWILSQVGEEIYEIFIKGYTTKQWNKKPSDLPSNIIKRLPIRTNFDDNYFFDTYQGIPKNGYTRIFEKMLKDIEIQLNTDYFENREKWHSMCDNLVYTGKIDEYFDYRFGDLEYRSLKFEEVKIEKSDYQGNSIINFTDIEIPYTRITEHKHFNFTKSDITWITIETPSNYNKHNEPFYPINDEINNEKYNKYKKLSEVEPKVIFGGRLAEYKYYDMHQIIASAINKLEKVLK